MNPNIQYFGKFILLKPIGEGGMGSVYLGRTKGRDGINKNVAIKMMHPDFASNPKSLDMFRHEAALAIKFNHANIIGVHEFGMINSQCYVVMDYVSGENLRYLIENLPYSKKVLVAPEILYIAKNIASGLDYLHRFLDPRTGAPLNIVHRDINPHNVMINFEGEIKIIDFGVAKTDLVAEKSFAQAPAGKVRYMSPEQLTGGEVNQSTDIFSTGIVMWEMIAGQQIFKGLKKNEVLEKIMNFQLPPLPAPREDLPFELIEILHRATARDPSERYPTTNLMLREISMALNKNYPDYTSEDFRESVNDFFADEIAMETDTQKKLATIGQPITADSEIWKEKELNEKAAPYQTRSLKTAPLKDRALEFSSWALQVDTLRAFALAALIYFVIFEGGKYLHRAYQNGDLGFQHSITDFKLRPRYRIIDIKSSPPGARVYLNDKPLQAITPVQIRISANRKNVIGLEKDGYLKEYVSVAREVSSITVLLSPAQDEISKRLEAILAAREQRIQERRRLAEQKAAEQETAAQEQTAQPHANNNTPQSPEAEALPKLEQTELASEQPSAEGQQEPDSSQRTEPTTNPLDTPEPLETLDDIPELDQDFDTSSP